MAPDNPTLLPVLLVAAAATCRVTAVLLLLLLLVLGAVLMAAAAVGFDTGGAATVGAVFPADATGATGRGEVDDDEDDALDEVLVRRVVAMTHYDKQLCYC